MNLKVKYILLLALISLVFSSCLSVKPVYYEQDIKTADETVKKFHQLLNDENYEALYELTDEQARATKSKDGFMLLMKELRSKFGKVVNSTKLEAKPVSQAASTKVEAIYQTKFENQEIKERFVLIVANNQAGISSFEIIP